MVEIFKYIYRSTSLLSSSSSSSSVSFLSHNITACANAQFQPLSWNPLSLTFFTFLSSLSFFPVFTPPHASSIRRELLDPSFELFLRFHQCVRVAFLLRLERYLPFRMGRPYPMDLLFLLTDFIKKGLVIERIQDSISEEDKRLIYLGDGSGDYLLPIRSIGKS
ncbi:uncharacterized protein LOC108336329 [Vigna angularis]|uniref:uncharacterized protein LOC108336329 n=1 Tax=Phaseolus angularis TaxID=3914 RepID=UPI0022B3E3E2|nr:uncharacterized protein LOC108336329 [Vigna angularis]